MKSYYVVLYRHLVFIVDIVAVIYVRNYTAYNTLTAGALLALATD